MTDHFARAREYASNGGPDAGLIHAILAAVEAARDMTASHRQARAVDLTEPKEDRR